MNDSSIACDPAKCLRAPWIRKRTFKIRKGRYQIQVYDQPGRWMTDEELAHLSTLVTGIARQSMDEVPTYGVFTGDREPFTNRVIGVMRERRTADPVAFTAMVYLPIELDGEVVPVIHLGLTMIKRTHRGQRLQSRLFEKMFFLPALNQLRVRWILTNIAASPAGIGSVSDYFDDAYPTYRGDHRCRKYHLRVAGKLLALYRHEFGCSDQAVFDPRTFVVAGSNDPDTGGAYQFIRVDPVSRYKHEACNRFCASRLRFDEGDELFQVARFNLLKGVVEILARIGTRRRDAAAAERRRAPARHSHAIR